MSTGVRRDDAASELVTRVALLWFAGRQYGFLFSVAIGVELKRGRQIQRRFVQRQSTHGGPEVEYVSFGIALGTKASKHLLRHVNGEATASILLRTMNRAGTAELGPGTLELR